MRVRWLRMPRRDSQAKGAFHVTPDETHAASYLLDLVDPNTEERFSLYRCGTCLALVVSEDVRDHGRWHVAMPGRVA